MAAISASLLLTELSFWTDLYEIEEGDMITFADYMNKKYMFNDEKLAKIELPDRAIKHIMENHVKKV